MDQLDDEKEREIRNLLNDEFCSLDIGAQAQGETCTVQNLEFRVKRNSCGNFLSVNKYFFQEQLNIILTFFLSNSLNEFIFFE